MHHFIMNITVFTFAMIGLIFFALLVYKKVSDFGINTKQNGNLKVVDMLRVAPSKSFYILAVGNEKFLVASDTNRMNLISKLENNSCVKDFE